MDAGKRATSWMILNDTYARAIATSSPATLALLRALVDGPRAAAKRAFRPRRGERDEVREATLHADCRNGALVSFVRVVKTPGAHAPAAVFPHYNTIDGYWYPRSHLPLDLISTAYSQTHASADPIAIRA